MFYKYNRQQNGHSLATSMVSSELFNATHFAKDAAAINHSFFPHIFSFTVIL